MGELALVSASGRVRLQAAEAFLARWPAATDVVVIGATREAADDLCRRVAATRGATFGLHRFTLTQLASRIAAAALAARGATPATALAADALATRALSELSRDGVLRHLVPVADSPGLPRALAETLGELREAGVSPERLAALAGAAAADLSALGTRYAALLEEGGLADRAELLATATARLAAGDAGGLPVAPLLLLDVPLATTAEGGFVAALVARSPDTLATIPAGDVRTEAHLPPALAATLERREEPGADALARVRRSLFAAEAETGPADESVRFFSAPGEGREAVEVARRILDEAARGVPFDEMAIVVRAPESYWGPIEQALERAKVPAWFSRGTRRPDPTGRAFLALLACAADDLSARSFAEYLSLGQVPRRDPATGRSAPDPAPIVVSNDPALAQGQLSLFDLLNDPGMVAAIDATIPGSFPDGHTAPSEERTDVRAPWRWESLLVDAAVASEAGPTGRAARWRRRLDGLRNELQLRKAELDSDEPESGKALAVTRDLEALEDLRGFALPLVDELAALPSRATWGAWLDRLASLAPTALRHPARVLELLADLRPMAAVGPVTLAEVRRVLLPRLAQLDREPPKHRFGRVFVATPDGLRGRTFRVVFVVGLAERVFPQRSRQDPLLLDGPRRALAASLATEDDRVAAERVRLRLAIGAATERCWLLYPRLDVGQGRARVPSFYALDVVRASTGTVPDYVRFERDTAMATGAWLAWPAPEEPATAIDTWEHDLAVLGRLLAAPVKGGAHYLLTDPRSAALARSLRTRYARWKRSWSAWDGLIGGNGAVQAHLAGQRLTARPYSVSALQRFTACPYQFLLGAIYRFQPLEQPEAIVQLDPLTRGAIFHEIQRDVLRALKAEGLLPVPPDRRGEAHAILDRVAREAFVRHHDRLAPAIERVWDDETALMQGDLRVWLRKLADTSAEWVPRYFELSFGLPIDDAHDAASVREPVVIDGRFPMRGAIDLVEQHGALGSLRVTDHKTGKNRIGNNARLVVGGGGTLQPIIYTLVAEAMLSLPVQYARLAFTTTAGGFSEHPVSVRDEHRRLGVEVLEIIDRAVELGALPQAPRKGACAWCDFRAVCGPLEEHRAARKHQTLAALDDLHALRALP